MTTAGLRFSVRSLEGRGCPWAPGPHVATVEVARDELQAWRAPAGPELVRVVAGDDAPNDAPAVTGDWFVAPDCPVPVRLPRPHWTYNSEALAWASERAWVDAWENCPEPTWMLAAVTSMPRTMLVAATAAIVRAPIEDLYTPNTGPRFALAEVDRWLKDDRFFGGAFVPRADTDGDPGGRAARLARAAGLLACAIQTPAAAAQAVDALAAAQPDRTARAEFNARALERLHADFPVARVLRHVCGA